MSKVADIDTLTAKKVTRFKPAGEKRFIKKHVVVIDDKNTHNNDIARRIKPVNRPEMRDGYNPGQDEKFYESWNALKKATGAKSKLGAIGAAAATIGSTAAGGAFFAGRSAFSGYGIPVGAAIGGGYALATLINRYRKARMNEEKEKEPLGIRTHLVHVVISDPNNPAVQHRKTQIARRVKLKAQNHEQALGKAKLYYKKRGFKVHDAFHVKELNEGKFKEQDIKNKEKKAGNARIISKYMDLLAKNQHAITPEGKDWVLKRMKKLSQTESAIYEAYEALQENFNRFTHDKYLSAIETHAKNLQDQIAKYSGYQADKGHRSHWKVKELSRQLEDLVDSFGEHVDYEKGEHEWRQKNQERNSIKLNGLSPVREQLEEGIITTAKNYLSGKRKRILDKIPVHAEKHGRGFDNEPDEFGLRKFARSSTQLGNEVALLSKSRELLQSKIALGKKSADLKGMRPGKKRTLAASELEVDTINHNDMMKRYQAAKKRVKKANDQIGITSNWSARYHDPSKLKNFMKGSK